MYDPSNHRWNMPPGVDPDRAMQVAAELQQRDFVSEEARRRAIEQAVTAQINEQGRLMEGWYRQAAASAGAAGPLADTPPPAPVRTVPSVPYVPPPAPARPGGPRRLPHHERKNVYAAIGLGLFIVFIFVLGLING